MSPIGLLGQCRGLAERIPYSVVALVSRIAVASVFWQSGQTKVAGFSIREETFALFSNIYKFRYCRRTSPHICQRLANMSSQRCLWSVSYRGFPRSDCCL